MKDQQDAENIISHFLLIEIKLYQQCLNIQQVLKGDSYIKTTLLNSK
jgi:hypothetical protein